MNSSHLERSAYRPEIQGIRTIGALLVAGFHIWGGRVSGGVDVFFVISGFLITGSLFREIQRSGTIDVVAFWGRIAKRTAPMAYTVLAVTLAVAMLWLPQSRQQAFLAEVLYSALHLENIKLMMNSVDYLARGEAPSPVQQFWALSVQVQFYAVGPFLLLALAFIARKLRSGTVLFTSALAVIFLMSLAYSIFETRLNPSPAYFNTFARAWEFALGGLLGISLAHVNIPHRPRMVAGWLGLVLVVSCGFVIPASVHYPGYVALWPTLGATLVLLSGGEKTGFGAERILAARPLVALGELSFSFYLWHWPILIFALILTRRTHLGLREGLLVIVVALCAAYVSNRWLEQPIQRSAIGKRRTWHVHAMAAAFALPILIVSSAWLIVNEREGERQQEAMKRMRADYPGGALPASAATAVKPGIPVYPTPAAVKGKHANRCQQNMQDPEAITCAYGVEKEARKTIALVGGSHAEHWLPALEIIARENRWTIMAITKSACPFIAGNVRGAACIEWNSNVHELLRKLRPDAVFTTSTRHAKSKDGRPIEIAPQGYIQHWEQLAENGMTVIAVRDNPRMRIDNMECIEANLQDPTQCALRRADLFSQPNPLSSLDPKLPNVSFVDLMDRFCDEELCLPVVGNVLVYRDSHHITIEYARTLAAILGERMRQVRPDLFLDTPETWRQPEVN